MRDQFIYTTGDTLRMLDGLLAERGGGWWNGFFSDRAKPCPFFVEWPDENLVEWFDEGRLGAGRVLELGSGHGRNASFLAGRGAGLMRWISRRRRWGGPRSGRRRRGWWW